MEKSEKQKKDVFKANNCNLDEILFIRDLEDTVSYLKDNGINAININEIR